MNLPQTHNYEIWCETHFGNLNRLGVDDQCEDRWTDGRTGGQTDGIATATAASKEDEFNFFQL